MSQIDEDFKLSQLPTDAETIAFCELQEALGDYSGTYVYPSREAPVAFIKCGAKDFGMKAELSNQEFVFNALKSLPQHETANILIPKIYRVVEREYILYVIMEYINGDTLKELLDKGLLQNQLEEYYTKIAQAIKLFISLKVPENATPGPVSGGNIKHPLFKDGEASIEYTSIDTLQKHVNNVINLPEKKNLEVNFQDEDLCFCYSDLYEGNFIFTDNYKLYIVDFDYAAFLPISFMTYAFDQTRPVCQAIKTRFELPQDNLKAMKVAGYNFMISWRGAGKYIVLAFVYITDDQVGLPLDKEC